MSEAGDGQTDTPTRQQLQRAQFVARSCDRDGLIEREHAHHLKLTQHGAAVEGHGGANARYHRIKAFQGFSSVVDLRLMTGDVHIGAQGIDHHDLVAALNASFDQTTS